jgi:LPXTG-motif cell wall-anchored protein
MRRIAILAAAVIASLTVASPAMADDELSVSNDGVTFARDLSAPLFDPAVKWVPGDVRTATVYVRNNDELRGLLDVDLLGNHVGDLLDSGDIHVTASAGTGTSGVASDGSERRILSNAKVDGGDVVPVAVTVSFDFSSPNETQLRSTDIRLRFTLTQNEFPRADDGNGELPDTGAPTLWILALGSILLGTGVAIVSRRRHTHLGDSHV